MDKITELQSEIKTLTAQIHGTENELNQLVRRGGPRTLRRINLEAQLHHLWARMDILNARLTAAQMGQGVRE